MGPIIAENPPATSAIRRLGYCRNFCTNRSILKAFAGMSAHSKAKPPTLSENHKMIACFFRSPDQETNVTEKHSHKLRGLPRLANRHHKLDQTKTHQYLLAAYLRMSCFFVYSVVSVSSAAAACYQTPRTKPQ